MAEKDFLSDMQDWVGKLRNIGVIAYGPIQEAQKTSKYMRLVDILKRSYAELIQAIDEAKSTHKNVYGSVQLSSATRSALASMRQTVSRDSEELKNYKGFGTDGKFDPTENPEIIDKMIAHLSKVRSSVEDLLAKIEAWMDAESQKNTEDDPKPLEDWQVKLRALKDDLFGKKPDATQPGTNYFSKDTEQHIRDSEKIQFRTLKADEHFGLIHAPVILIKHFITDAGWEVLEKAGYTLKWVANRYMFIDNATIMGVSEQMTETILADEALRAANIIDVMNIVLQRLNQFKNTHYKLYGQVVKKGYHYYVLVLPGSVASEDLRVFQWSFQKPSS